jgi:hypothetical protein
MTISSGIIHKNLRVMSHDEVLENYIVISSTGYKGYISRGGI